MSDGENVNSMDPQRFDELKEAYALNALSQEEREEFERHLSENPSEQAELDELLGVANLLALAPQEKEPSAGLRKGLMSQVRAEAKASGSSEAASAAGHERSRGSRGGWASRLFGARGIATAAVAAALVGLLVWNVSLQSEMQNLRDLQAEAQEPRDTQMSAYDLSGSGEATSVKGEVVRIGDQGAMMVATDLPSLPEGKTYEMWSIDEEKPESCGVFEAGDGPAIQPIDQSISGAETFAITVEPEGGSEQPTTDPIVLADLTSGT
jgi:anti-sigma-K factor RskA